MSFPTLKPNSRTDQERPEASLLLPDASDRSVLPLAMSLARAWGAQLAAYAWESPNDHLPERLRWLVEGHRGSPADIAVHNLISSAFRGTQIPLRRFDPASTAPENTTERLRMLGWQKGTRPKSLAEAAACLDKDGEMLLLLDSGDGVPFDEVLVVDWEQGTTEERRSLEKLGRGLERPYPLWHLKASKASQLSRAQKDLGKRSLLLLSPCAKAGWPLDRIEDIEKLSPGPVALLLASGAERSSYLADLWGGAG